MNWTPEPVPGGLLNAGSWMESGYWLLDWLGFTDALGAELSQGDQRVSLARKSVKRCFRFWNWVSDSLFRRASPG